MRNTLISTVPGTYPRRGLGPANISRQQATLPQEAALRARRAEEAGIEEKERRDRSPFLEILFDELAPRCREDHLPLAGLQPLPSQLPSQDMFNATQDVAYALERRGRIGGAG